MRTLGWNILVLAFAALASGQVLKDCSAPDKYPNTRLETKYARRQKFSNKEKVYYSCDAGFTASKGFRIVQCDNGQWTKLSLKCEKVSCGNAGDLPYGEFRYEGNAYLGEKVYAVCNKGYILKGPNYMICKESGWDGEFPTCEEGEVTCSTPAVVNSVQRGGDVSVYQVGDNLTFTCSEGFQLDGAQVITCDPSGQWQPQPPRCVPAPDDKIQPTPAGSCAVPQTIYNTNAQLADRFTTKTSFSSGEKVYYICDVGYTLAGGRKSRICNNGKWTPLTLKCQQEEVTCSTPAVVNSVQRGGDVSVYQVGDNLTFTCSEGFQLDGAQVITCDPSGQWQPQPPRCVPAPDDKIQPTPAGSCAVPQTIYNTNSQLADRFTTKTSFSSGEKVYYVCDVGYIPAGGRKSRICINGKWTPLTLKCQRKSCGSAGEILNGHIVYTGVEFGDTAKATCDDGFICVGRATRHCMLDGWSGRNPVCEAVVCDDPPEVTNAIRTGIQDEPYRYRSAVRYRCRVGTLIGEREIWCTKNGTWSAPAPACKEITCPSPNVPNAYWTGNHNQRFQYSATISIQCNPGYGMIGPSIVSCEHDGRWVPELPKCQRRSHFINRWG